MSDDKGKRLTKKEARSQARSLVVGWLRADLDTNDVTDIDNEFYIDNDEMTRDEINSIIDSLDRRWGLQ